MNHELVNDFVQYHPDGRLTWRARTVDLYLKHSLAELGMPNIGAWNATNEGRSAFAMRLKTGALYGNFFGKRLAAADVVWLLHAKAWPAGYMYHINSDKADNRMENLARAKPTDALKQRLGMGLWATDRLETQYNQTMVIRNGAAHRLFDTAERTPAELDAIMRLFDMVH
jgi:hypothetical protein